MCNKEMYNVIMCVYYYNLQVNVRIGLTVSRLSTKMNSPFKEVYQKRIIGRH